ncbi:MAG: putative hemolysin, partial [Paraglaciecola sp.]
ETRNEDGSYHFSGRLEVNYLNAKYDLGLPDGEYQTLSGFIVAEAERVPEQDEELELSGFHCRMIEVTNTRIEVVRIRKEMATTEN